MNFKLLFIVALSFIVTGCSREHTREFFFGESGGVNPFSVGATLDPLDMNVSSQATLPKPKAQLPFHKQPSRARKAGDLLELGTTQLPTEQAINKADGSVVDSKKIDQKIDFVEFDKQMTQTYQEQESRGYLLDDIIGKKKSIDPTIQEALDEKDQDK